MTNLHDMISQAYPDIEHVQQRNDLWLCERTIFSQKNSSVESIVSTT